LSEVTAASVFVLNTHDPSSTLLMQTVDYSETPVHFFQATCSHFALSAFWRPQIRFNPRY